MVKKSKKPPVEEYDVELWVAANFRIILHLIRLPVPYKVLCEYLEYSSVIAEYLGLYLQRGVFLLDYEHRIRVAREGRAWTDISSLDERRFLVFIQDSFEQTSKKTKKGKSRNRSSKVKLDTSGDPICINYNARQGCSY